MSVTNRVSRGAYTDRDSAKAKNMIKTRIRVVEDEEDRLEIKTVFLIFNNVIQGIMFGNSEAL
jgi:hypothetical protein